MSELHAIRARVRDCSTYNFGMRAADKLAHDDAPRLLAALDAVEALADGWHARGESDMAYSKTIPDEDIAMEILTNGAQMVENARHIRNALTTALGGGE